MLSNYCVVFYSKLYISEHRFDSEFKKIKGHCIPLKLRSKSVDDACFIVAITATTSIIRTYFSIKAKHPEKPRQTEIDFNTVRISYPLFLLGSYAGVLTSIAIPELVLSIILLVLLVAASVGMFRKGTRMWAEESRQMMTSDDDYVD